MDLVDQRNNQPIGSQFVGEIDHNEIKHIEVIQKLRHLYHKIVYFNIIIEFSFVPIVICSFFVSLLCQVVGKGAFGTVYKAQWRDNFVAVKYIEPETERNAFRIEVIWNAIASIQSK